MMKRKRKNNASPRSASPGLPSRSPVALDKLKIQWWIFDDDSLGLRQEGHLCFFR